MSEKDIDATLDHIIKRLKVVEDNGIPGVRDFFATSALSFLANEFWSRQVSPEGIAKRAYTIADAMMKERDKKE